MAAKKCDDDLRAKIIGMYVEEHLGSSSIAKTLGLGSTTVLRILNNADVKRDQSTRFIPEARQFNDAEAHDMAGKYAGGVSLDDIADQYGGTRWMVRKAIRRDGRSIRKRGPSLRSFTSDQIEEMKRLWEAGLSQTAIGAVFSTTQSVVSNALKFHGVTVEHRQAKGDKHGSWKGGRHISEGYTYIRVPFDSPFASMRNTGGYVFEHRLVVAQALGRPLTSNESVHHIDGDRSNNELDNLQLRRGQHGKNACFCCGDCGSKNVVAVPLVEQQ